MNPKPVAVFFDVDGVLIDSLPQHLQFCADKAAEYGLSIVVPEIDAFRALVANGLRISPMNQFLFAVGFPEPAARRALADYEDHFAQRYQPQQFAGVPSMLARLRQCDMKLGIVTSNTRKNAEAGLGELMSLFEPSCTFFHEPGSVSMTKTLALVEGVRRLGTTARQCVFVGDQPADAKAAREAGLQFLPVSYGWAFLGDGAVEAPEGIVGRLCG